jgi:hypothetical protein
LSSYTVDTDRLRRIGRSQEPADCPSLTVIGPSGITWPGDNVTFVVDTNADTKELKFYWTVSDGVIEEGQGTTAIKVTTSRDNAGKTIEATVDVQGFEKGCSSRAWENAPIAAIPEIEVLDQFANLEPDDVRARMDAFFLELTNYPKQHGWVILHITKDQELSETNPRFKLIVDQARFREFPLDRITFLFQVSEFNLTNLYRLGPEREYPCDDCIEVRPIPLQ